MKQLLQKPFVTLSIVIAIILSSISARESMWPSNMPQLTQDIKNACVQFRLQNGSNRIAEYNKIEQSLFVDKTQTINKNDLIKILGPPNKATTTQLQYWLQDAANKTTLTININETSMQVTGYGVSGS